MPPSFPDEAVSLPAGGTAAPRYCTARIARPRRGGFWLHGNGKPWNMGGVEYLSGVDSGFVADMHPDWGVCGSSLGI